MSQRRVIAIVGPTASGKSALGAFLARKLRGKVISADSRQIYKGMRILSRAESGAMVGIVDPRRTYSAGAYAKDATHMISSFTKLPILVGGAGFYADALLATPLPSVAPNQKLRSALHKKTPLELVALLKKLDGRSAARVDPNNKVRLIRALEIAKALGAVPPLSRHSPYRTLWLGLPAPKNYGRVLRKGIEERLRRGMVAEARALRKKLTTKRFEELGFEFDLLAEFLDKAIAKEEFIERMVALEQRYAKRQMRWFRRSPDIRWIKNKREALRLAKKFLSG